MNKFFKAIAAPIVLIFKTLTGAREFVEDRIADVLDRVQASDSFDAVEKKVIKAGDRKSVV